ncbi:MAG: carboxypeptidase-like regulatory domain-containing protein, partial [Planctomycetota bacterium]
MRPRFLLLGVLFLAALAAVLLFWNPGRESFLGTNETTSARGVPLAAAAPSNAQEAAAGPASPQETRQAAPGTRLARVRLTVRFGDTFLPFADAAVALLWQDPSGSRRKEEGRTDERGVWEWMPPSGGRLLEAHVEATSATAPATKPLQESLAPDLDMEVELSVEPAGRIAGVVKDERGQLVARATVSGWNGQHSRGEGSREPGDPAAETRTDSEGRYELSGFGPEFTLFARAPGLVADRSFRGSLPESRHLEGVDFVLVPSYALTGQVVGPDRRPVEGAKIHLGSPKVPGLQRATGITGVFQDRNF